MAVVLRAGRSGGPGRREPRGPALARTVWFHRDHVRFGGGHLKHAHYMAHAHAKPGFAAAVAFSGTPPGEALARERARLWPGRRAAWEPVPGDVLFLAGTDWRYLHARGLADLPNPRVNLLQDVRHAVPGTELFGWLAHRAVRVCVSAEVADAVAATGRANGPVLAIPAGIDPAPRADGAAAARRVAVLVLAYKAPALGRALSAELAARGVAHRTLYRFVDRPVFRALLADAEVAVALPRSTEGFYLPALEAMAAGCLTVTVAGIGNRGFCDDGANCLLGGDAGSLADAVVRARNLPAPERARLHATAAATVAAHSLAAERTRFHAVLDGLDTLWRDGQGRVSLPAALASPRVDFMVVGAQQCGTAALASLLAAHPQVGMAAPPETHLFDDPDYGPHWSRARIDARYAACFQQCSGALVRGEATPIYLYLPEVAAELARYNPELRLIVLLRDPAERAVSHYYLRKGRGAERRPFWLALLVEPFLLRFDRAPRASGSATRARSYRARGRYGRQLENLYRHFPPERVLVVRQGELRDNHDAVMGRVLGFLGVDHGVRMPSARVFAGAPHPRHRLAKAVLRLTYLADAARLRRLGVRP